MFAGTKVFQYCYIRVKERLTINYITVTEIEIMYFTIKVVPFPG